MGKVLDRNKFKTKRSGVFAQGVLTAAEMFFVEGSEGLTSIPKDIRVVGIDDVGYASLLPVPLTTIHQPCRAIGMAAMDTMISRLTRPEMPAREVLLEVRLVVRESCGATLPNESKAL